jgi:enoyl-CoA hydratase
MSDISIRIDGRAGRITLNRPTALNALTYDMCLAIDAALIAWADNDTIDLLILDANGDKAFCAGGDITEMYASGTAGDFAYGRKFWRDEYRMNARLFNFPKPVVSLLQGFTMGGGVGVGCHGSHRIVGESSKIAMPECGIGLIPDVGGSLILARAPGHLGEYVGMTAYRMGPADAILVGFADYFVPETAWPALIAKLCETGDPNHVDAAATAPGDAPLAAMQADIDAEFDVLTTLDLFHRLKQRGDAFATDTLKRLSGPAPLSVACTLQLVRRVRPVDSIDYALEQEYRFTYRSAEQGEFLEGIRAAVIDKDRTPKWRHASIKDVPLAQVTGMLMPLGDAKLNLKDTA